MSEPKNGERHLRKVTMNPKGLTVKWEIIYTDEQGNTQSILDERTVPERVHDDFVDSWKPLVEHIGMIVGFLPIPSKRPDFDGEMEGADIFKVKSVTLTGGTDKQPLQVFITGNKRLEGGRVVNFVTPGVRVNNAMDPYEFAQDLSKHLDVIESEVWEYIDKGKRSPVQASNQTRIDDPESGAGEEGGGEKKMTVVKKATKKTAAKKTTAKKTTKKK